MEYSEEWFLFVGPINTNKIKIERALKKYYTFTKKDPNEKINILNYHEFGRHPHTTLLLNVGINREDIYNIIAERLRDSIEVIRNTYAKPYKNLNNNKAKQLLNNENINNQLKI